MLLTSVLLGIAMAILVIMVAFLFSGGNELDANGNPYGNLTINHVMIGLCLGALVWAIYYFCSARNIAIVGVVLVAVMAIAMVIWSCREASRWYEVLLTTGILLILWHTAITALATFVTGLSWRYTVPTIVFIVALAIVWIRYFVYHYLGLHLIQPVTNAGYLLGAILTAILAIILIICLLTGLLIPASARGANKDKSQSDVVTEEVVETTSGDSTWYYFFNSELQRDGDAKNDYNFGPDPMKNDWTAADYDKEFRRRVKLDPALAAADTAWLDAKVGTRYLGEFYESCKGDWAKTMNAAKVRFMEDQEAYYKNLDAFFAFLDKAVKVEIRECKAVSDQMYMNPDTIDGVPDIIVMLTDDHSGYELVYTFLIKDNVFEVAYRINCGYQPTNVVEIMKITPQQPPQEPEQPTEPPYNPPTEPTTEPEESKYDKDPKKAPKKNTEENDDKGSGDDTNNGKGSQNSTKDKDTNSNHYDSYEEYTKEINDLKDTNKNQKTNKDSNDSSTKSDKNTNVDNNGDKGNGGDSINTETSTKDPAKTEDGKEINTEPAGSWGGPED